MVTINGENREGCNDLTVAEMLDREGFASASL